MNETITRTARLADRPARTGVVRDWMAYAACRDHNPEKWYPLGETPQHKDEVAEAIAVCNTCPVRAQCLARALDGLEREGIWGGLTPLQRRNLRSKAHEGEDGAATVDRTIAAAVTEREDRDFETIYRRRTTQDGDSHAMWIGEKNTIYYQGRQITVMQLVFYISFRRWPDGKVTASCGVPKCVARGHQSDRIIRADTNGGLDPTQTHCVNGHEYTPETTYVYPPTSSKAGDRRCRICSREQSSKDRERAKERAKAHA